MDVKVLVATHKEYCMPKEPMYIPVSAGAFFRENNWGYSCDNDSQKLDGEISNKNLGYNELSVLYWGWKNVSSEYLGLVHYRRYLAHNNGRSLPEEYDIRLNNILKLDELEKVLQKYDMILPKKRNYYIQSLKSHFLHANPHLQEQYDLFRNVIAEIEPSYLSAFDKVMSRSYGHLFNIFIMKREYMDEYCKWLYNILFEAEKRITAKGLVDKRFYGLMSEYMLDTWNEVQKIKYHELPVLYIEKENKKRKAINFVKRLFRRISKS